MNGPHYQEYTEILAVLTSKVDRYGRIGGLKKYRGRNVRVLILLRDPTFQRPEVDSRRL